MRVGAVCGDVVFVSLRIITNGADVNDIECKAGACNGCVVMQAPEYKEKACYLY